MGKYTAIDDPSTHFQVKKWTGNAGTNAITLDGNSDMQPDFMWHKEQNDTNGWHQFDSSRGVTKYLASNSNGAEGTFANYLSSFDSNGFTAGSGDSSMNSSGTAQCSWMWHCNGGTTSTNNDGSLTSTVQVNQDAGFSIVTYAGANSTNTVGHGLGVAPKMIIIRARDKDVPSSWVVFHKDGSASDDDYLLLNGTGAKASQSGLFNNQYPSSTTFGIANDFWVSQSGFNYVAYCFAEKQGYSKFGTYKGNGAADGPFVYTGFKPAFVILKGSNASGSWYMLDNKRDVDNVANHAVEAQSTAAEYTNYNFIDMLSNGFKLRLGTSEVNTDGNSYIYMAFAEHPFVTSTGIMGTAR